MWIQTENYVQKAQYGRFDRTHIFCYVKFNDSKANKIIIWKFEIVFVVVFFVIWIDKYFSEFRIPFTLRKLNHSINDLWAIIFEGIKCLHRWTWPWRSANLQRANWNYVVTRWLNVCASKWHLCEQIWAHSLTKPYAHKFGIIVESATYMESRKIPLWTKCVFPKIPLKFPKSCRKGL